jgi:replicative DNA helicase
LAVSFDPNVGHDYLEDSSDRFDFYHKVEQRVPFDLAMFNKITKGGLPKKTLNCILAGVNVGKSLALCHVAASTLAQNLNVLYITMEMSQEQIAKRIDANLLDVSIDDIEGLSKEQYERKINLLKQHVKGKLIIKEYPTASAGAHHFKALINECKLKKKFKPDIVIIDYVNICCSSRIKPGSNINSYTYIKAIAEELRGLAVETDVPILTATQLTRTGFNDSDPDMTDTAESFGLPATCDWMVVMVTSEELEALDQIMIKQIKSRYYNVTQDKKFAIGVNRAKMRLHDIDENKTKQFAATGGSPKDKFVQDEDIQNVMRDINKNKGGKKPAPDIKV